MKKLFPLVLAIALLASCTPAISPNTDPSVLRLSFEPVEALGAYSLVSTRIEVSAALSARAIGGAVYSETFSGTSFSPAEILVDPGSYTITSSSTHTDGSGLVYALLPTQTTTVVVGYGENDVVLTPGSLDGLPSPEPSEVGGSWKFVLGATSLPYGLVNERKTPLQFENGVTLQSGDTVSLPLASGIPQSIEVKALFSTAPVTSNYEVDIAVAGIDAFGNELGSMMFMYAYRPSESLMGLGIDTSLDRQARTIDGVIGNTTQCVGYVESTDNVLGSRLSYDVKFFPQSGQAGGFITSDFGAYADLYRGIHDPALDFASAGFYVDHYVVRATLYSADGSTTSLRSFEVIVTF